MPMFDRRVDKRVGCCTTVSVDEQSGIGLSVRQQGIDAACLQQLLTGTQRENRLAVPILILDEFERVPVGAQGIDRFGAVGQHQPVVEHRRRRFETDIHVDRITRRPAAPTPSVDATKRATAPSSVSRPASATSASPSHPSATRMATRRVRILPSPGRANRDSDGDTETSGVTSRFSTFGIGAGNSRMPKPAATGSASSRATFSRPDTIRSRTAGVCTRESSKRNALMMCCFSTSVWLFQNNVAWV